ncbi:cell wall teichoic acid glycosylation protein gtcA [Ligilactobacillus pobuzihii E100301 = KCTC 13174]|uniref:Cell wall teichoic acid glycosylation protein gtcA n=2 Tax=Ligilactobacillus pobuzihii TaxID=449659 RepID=A0A0R2LBB8_9LACO|nr:cell wall teichoic acid glycosylation protein gtcA [Ligilactobacillus pobuzihii E100301 = KCTC 13174]KRN98816.1 cell wall teichoic acid glycosylation protein gtcA [Ligilactobacillus pobuzihii]GEN49043.1 membrane protein [Ligilactobacillus pobuzihii]
MEMIKKMWLKYKGVIAYLFFGGLTTLINIVAFYLFGTVFDLYYQLANVIAWLLSVLFAFFTNKVWVFGSKYTTAKAFWSEMGKFFFYRGVSLLVDAFIMYLGISVFKIDDNLTKLIDQVFVVVINYFFSKFLIFKTNDK